MLQSIGRGAWPYGALAGLVLVAVVAGVTLGHVTRRDLPDVSALENYAPPIISSVLAADGSLVDTFAEQRRILIEYRDIPEVFRQALVATEDSDFHDHEGIDYAGIVRAAWANVTSFRRRQGASTLTQQLARNLFLRPDKTFRRKFQEALLAIEIERLYSKEEILGFYCNQVYMGHGRYGLQAASRFYLGKPAREMDLAEAAMLAGLIQRPEAISPFKDPERAVQRRDHVLRRMVDEGYITREQAEEAGNAPCPTRRASRQKKLAPYFVEEVRRWLTERYGDGDTNIYRAGLEVRTTLDPRMQAVAVDAVERGLRELDRRQGWRGVPGRVPDGEDPATWRSADWDNGLQAGDVTDGVVLSVDDDVATVRVGELRGTLGRKQTEWARQGGTRVRFASGDVLRVRIESVADDGATATLALEQEPLVEAALLAIDPGTGAVRALVGGFDFERSEFNRAIQARRQTGSAFKPFVFAAALEQGWTLGDTLVDQPTVFLDPTQPTPYLPRNYKRNYYGSVTLRQALEKSANVATVELLNRVGADAVIHTARSLGVTSDLRPFPSLALGSFEVSLLELTAAYGTFGNRGVRVEPYLVREVRDRSGAVVLHVEPEVRDAISSEVAYLMNRMLAGVITDGTGRAAASLGFPLAGKTGTTDDNTDAWFVGYSPEVAVGVWVGFDTKRSLGSRETGAVAALPIWRRFMDGIRGLLRGTDFPRSADTRVVVIDRDTGLRASSSAGCQRFAETFVRGTEPTGICSVAEHQRLRLPYAFQRYSLNERGKLQIPDLDLQELLADEPLVFLTQGGTRLEYLSDQGVVSLPLELLPGGGTQPLSEAILAKLEELEADPEDWLGTDGRKARIELFRH